MQNEVQMAIHFLKRILQNGEDYTAYGLSELIEINNGNKTVILKHLKAINNIINKAINELKGKIK